MNTIIDHYIQKDILRTLSHASTLRFSEIKPHGLANNIFMYHLKHLLSLGLVLRAKDGYLLSNEGLRYIDRATRTNLDLRPQPKLISLLVIKNEQNCFVMYPRYAQPLMGKLVLPSGRLHFGESIDEHVTRELREKIGITPVMKYRGSGTILLSQDGEAMTHVYAHILYGEVVGRPLLTSQDPRFAPRWVNLDGLDYQSLVPGTIKVIEYAEYNDSTFLDLDISSAS